MSMDVYDPATGICTEVKHPGPPSPVPTRHRATVVLILLSGALLAGLVAFATQRPLRRHLPGRGIDGRVTTATRREAPWRTAHRGG